MITFDFTNMMSEAVGRNGVNTDDINSLKEQLEIIHSDIVKRRLPELYFLDLPAQDAREIITKLLTIQCRFSIIIFKKEWITQIKTKLEENGN